MKNFKTLLFVIAFTLGGLSFSNYAYGVVTQTFPNPIDISSYTNLTVSATGLQLSGDAVASAAGYSIPLSASTTAWEGIKGSLRPTELYTASGTITALNTVSTINGVAYSATSTLCLPMISSTSFATASGTLRVYLDSAVTILNTRCISGGGTSIEVSLASSSALMTTTTCGTAYSSKVITTNNMFEKNEPIILRLTEAISTPDWIAGICFGYRKR